MDFRNVAQNPPEPVFECSVPSWKSQLWKGFPPFLRHRWQILEKSFSEMWLKTCQNEFFSALCPREKVSSGRIFPPFLRYRWQTLEKSISKEWLKTFPKEILSALYTREKSALEGFSQHFCETRMACCFKISFRVAALFQPFLWHNYLQIVAKCFVFWKIQDYELSKMINFRSSIPRFSKWPIGKFNHYTPEGIKERFPPETPMLAEFDTRKTHNNFDSIKNSTCVKTLWESATVTWKIYQKNLGACFSHPTNFRSQTWKGVSGVENHEGEKNILGHLKLRGGTKVRTVNLFWNHKIKHFHLFRVRFYRIVIVQLCQSEVILFEKNVKNPH